MPSWCEEIVARAFHDNGDGARHAGPDVRSLPRWSVSTRSPRRSSCLCLFRRSPGHGAPPPGDGRAGDGLIGPRVWATGAGTAGCGPCCRLRGRPAQQRGGAVEGLDGAVNHWRRLEPRCQDGRHDLVKSQASAPTPGRASRRNQSKTRALPVSVSRASRRLSTAAVELHVLLRPRGSSAGLRSSGRRLGPDAVPRPAAWLGFLSLVRVPRITKNGTALPSVSTINWPRRNARLLRL